MRDQILSVTFLLFVLSTGVSLNGQSATSVVDREVGAILKRLEEAATSERDAELAESAAGADAAVLAALALEAQRGSEQKLSWRNSAGALAAEAERMQQIIASSSSDRRVDLERSLARCSMLVKGAAASPSKTESIELADCAPRPGLMWRMDRVLKLVRDDVTTAELLDRRRSEVVHETQLLRMMARLIGDESYDFAGDEEFQQLRGALAANAEAMARAAKGDDVELLQRHRAAARENCKACHQSFRN